MNAGARHTYSAAFALPSGLSACMCSTALWIEKGRLNLLLSAKLLCNAVQTTESNFLFVAQVKIVANNGLFLVS